ncbi:hypothetical protein ACIBIZ_29440 [Nonomuraea spiralis]|uniref:hypothetical protein n=1 Tax=Nonomuraea spiralis TaxID=46182 RepID=UPI0037B87365
MRLVNWLVSNVCGVPVAGPPARRDAFVRACAEGDADLSGIPPVAAAIIRRHAPVAAAMNGFYWDLFGADRATPFPREQVEHALAPLLADPPREERPGTPGSPGPPGTVGTLGTVGTVGTPGR